MGRETNLGRQHRSRFLPFFPSTASTLTPTFWLFFPTTHRIGGSTRSQARTHKVASVPVTGLGAFFSPPLLLAASSGRGERAAAARFPRHPPGRQPGLPSPACSCPRPAERRRLVIPGSELKAGAEEGRKEGKREGLEVRGQKSTEPENLSGGKAGAAPPAPPAPVFSFSGFLRAASPPAEGDSVRSACEAPGNSAQEFASASAAFFFSFLFFPPSLLSLAWDRSAGNPSQPPVLPS